MTTAIKRWTKLRPAKQEYVLTSFVLLRVLGFVYFFAFLSLATQVIPLLGENGLLPAKNFLATFKFESKLEAFMTLPTIFWFYLSDNLMLVLAWLGVILSFAVLIGFADSIMMLLLWLIYMSFVHVGQIFYSYGWEIQLLETGFMAVFLCPFLDPRPFAKPPKIIIWLFRWLAFRIYLGAGLIKLRADECWRNLTCLYYHYETQPIPNPLSPYLHFMPKWFHNFGVLWNHFIELIVPWFVFYPRIARYIAGILLISFQLILILSGNLSFLNWITIVPAIACFDDKFFRRILPKWLLIKAEKTEIDVGRYYNLASFVLLIVVIGLSIPVVQNLMSSRQYMNTSFNRWDFVNTYGAFGSVGKERYELAVQGTQDKVITQKTEWKEYEFKAKPTGIYRPLPIIAPYQPRVDWQIWFAAMQRPEHNPWLVHMLWKFLHNDENVLSLIEYNPFPDKPPMYIKVSFYRYQFAQPGNKEGKIWERAYIGEWLPPISAQTPGFKDYVKANGWEN